MSKVKILSWNLNGIRTRFKNKQLEPVFSENADIMLFQETKANYSQLDNKLKTIENYNSYFSKDLDSSNGGVSAYSKDSAKIAKKFLKNPNDEIKGRILNLNYNDFNLLNVDLPSAAKDLKLRERILKELIDYLKSTNIKKTIIAGDFSIAHSEKDIEKNELENSKSFKKEAELLDELLAIGFEDSFRLSNADSEEYSYFKSPKAKEDGIGSRVDYFFVSNDIKDNIKSSKILNIEGSKHLPIELEIEL
ncbi:exodeoxyribonuclease III [Methanobrevibacter curvatus]|uniref:Exodeoxyribonuclease n=1 Tax=Methanobrevibacter curvatus TaxID=49547 RepID=A0A166BZM1_9EURY|nr:exodeoxyribonuclease III [Methanobrevibacter curvatus]KZX10097.1 exodeoxyribonuclease [Methanobrevibacter curvatus]